MRTTIFEESTLLDYFLKEKIANLHKLKHLLGTKASMTVFRKLKKLQYISSCSHSGKYYTLERIAEFDNDGLWFYHSVLFSQFKTLSKTIQSLIYNSEYGFSTNELEKKLHLKPNEVLLKLIKSEDISREKLSGKYIYFSNSPTIRKRQELLRKESIASKYSIELEPEILLNEIKAAIILFYSILDEKQRRLFAGLESLRIGHGGDTMVADFLDLNIKTVSKGRKELLEDKIIIDTIRETGGGRKPLTKKKRS